MIACTRRLTFCAGHRVLGHGGKCRSWHGHQYIVFVTAEAPELDDLGMVVDFSVLKERIGAWIDLNWDHGFLLHRDDGEMLQVMKLLGDEHKTYQLPYNPTAENIARYLLEIICPQLMDGSGVRVTRVVVWETDNCYAEAST